MWVPSTPFRRTTDVEANILTGFQEPLGDIEGYSGRPLEEYTWVLRILGISNMKEQRTDMKGIEREVFEISEVLILTDHTHLPLFLWSQ